MIFIKKNYDTVIPHLSQEKTIINPSHNVTRVSQNNLCRQTMVIYIPIVNPL